MVDADTDPTVLALWKEIYGNELYAEPADLPRKEVYSLARAFGTNLPEFGKSKGNCEGYVRAVVRLIQGMGLQYYPNEVLMNLKKNLGCGTAEGNVVDGLLERAEEQAKEVLSRTQTPTEEIQRLTQPRSKQYGEYRVVKLLRAIINHYSRRESPYELQKSLRAMIFKPEEESVSEYLQRYLEAHQRCRVRGVRVDMGHALHELAETLPETVQTRAGGPSTGTFPLRGTIRKYVQEHPGADAHDLGFEIRRNVRFFNLDIALDEGEELPKQKVRQFHPGDKSKAEKQQDDKPKDQKKKKKKRPKRVDPTDEQVQEILAEIEIGKESEKPCAICAKYNPHLSDKHATDHCWNHPDVEKPAWLGKRKRVNRLVVRAVDGKVASDAELRVRIAEDLFALVDTGATVSTIHPRTESKLQVVQKLAARTLLYMADGQQSVVSDEKWKVRLAAKEGNAIDAWFVVTDSLEEEMIIGMNVLGDESGMEGFAILPSRGVLQLNRKGMSPLRFELKPRESIRAMVRTDPLGDEDEFGVPPQSSEPAEEDLETTKTWKKALERDPTNDPNWTKTSAERVQEIWAELQIGIHEDSMELSEEHRDRIRTVLAKYGHVFRDEVRPIDPQYGTHKIELKPGTTPISQHQYSLRPQDRKAVREFVQNKLRQGLIREATSPWNSPLLVVPKADGKPRVCFDGRKLNEVTIRDQYPMPNANVCLRRMKGSTIFSVGDMLSGYWQISLDEGSKQYTAFSCEDGQYEENSMSMGLVNAGATFSKVVHKVGEELPNLFLIIYIDDWLIHFRPEVDDEPGRDPVLVHLDQVEVWLNKLSKAGLALKAKKTRLVLRQVRFLGHVVSNEGMMMNPEKVEAITNAPYPESKKAVRAWLGMVNFYRQYMKNVSKTLAPLYELTKKDKPEKVMIKKGSPEAAAIESIKSALSSEPVVLHHPDFNKQFTIETDGSVSGLGAVLTQEGKVIEYASRKLNQAESNYTTRELECLALLFGVRKFHQYLGSKFKAVVDHKNLLQLQSYVKHNRRLARWAVALSEYEIELEYRKGEDHVPADFMSRLPSYGSKATEPPGGVENIRGYWDILEHGETEEEEPWTERYWKVIEQGHVRGLRWHEPDVTRAFTQAPLGLEEFNQQQKGIREEFSSQQAEMVLQDSQFPPRGSRPEIRGRMNRDNYGKYAKVRIQTRARARAEKGKRDREAKEAQEKAKATTSTERPIAETEAKKATVEEESEPIRDTDVVQIVPMETPPTKEDIRAAQARSREIQEIVADLKKGDQLHKNKWSYLYAVDAEGLLRYKGIRVTSKKSGKDCGRVPSFGRDSDFANRFAHEIENRIVVPESLRKKLMWHFHNHALGGHRGHETMYFEMAQRFYWFGMYADVKAHVKNCLPCRQAKHTKTSRRDRLARSINMVPFAVLFIDHVEIPAKNPFGFTHVLTMMDGFTRFLIAEPVTSTEAWVTEATVWDRVICALGRIPEVIVCDNGFDSEEWRKFCRDMGVTPSLTAPYNPRANLVERPHRFLKALFRINAQAMGQRAWPMLLQTEVRVFNSLRSDKKLSPFEVLMGFQPETPVERLLFPTRKKWEGWEAEAHFSQLVLHLREQRGRHVKNLVKSADADIERAIRDPKRYGPKLEKGDLVLMEQSKMGSRTPGTATKLFMQTTGPHRILRKMPGADIFEIELGDSKLRRKVPGERLRKLPPTVEDPYPHRLQWVLEGTSDESGWKVIAHHNIGDIVAFTPIKRKRYEHMNIQLGIIVGINLKEDEKPIRVHLMGTRTTNWRDQHAHTKRWYRLMLKDGKETATPRLPSANTRQRTAGRVVADIEYKDMLLIPPIRLNQDGSLMARSLDDLKRALKDRKAKEPRRGKEKVSWLKVIQTEEDAEEPPKKVRKLGTTSGEGAATFFKEETSEEVPWKRLSHQDKIRIIKEGKENGPQSPGPHDTFLTLMARMNPSKEWDNF